MICHTDTGDIFRQTSDSTHVSSHHWLVSVSFLPRKERSLSDCQYELISVQILCSTLLFSPLLPFPLLSPPLSANGCIAILTQTIDERIV